MRNGLMEVSHKIVRQIRNCDGQLFTRLLISPCSGNHRVFSQDLAKILWPMWRTRLLGCWGKAVSQVCLGTTDKLRLLCEVFWIFSEKITWRMDGISNSGDQPLANDQRLGQESWVQVKRHSSPNYIWIFLVSKYQKNIQETLIQKS